MTTKDAETEETIDIAKRIIDWIGGDPGLQRIGAKFIRTIPQGLEFLVPHGARVTVTKNHDGYWIWIEGGGWHQGGHICFEDAERDLSYRLDQYLEQHKKRMEQKAKM